MSESNKPVLITVAIAALGVGALFLLPSGEKQPAPQPPAQVVASVPATATEEAPPQETDAVRDALLGQNKRDERAQARRPKPRRIHRIVEEEEEVVDEGPKILTDGAFQATIGNWRGVKSCVAEAEAARKEDVTGALRVAFMISSEGEVLDTKVYDASSDSSRAITPCVERQAKLVRFPAFSAAESVTKEAKFVF
jgi:hypothetical protein